MAPKGSNNDEHIEIESEDGCEDVLVMFAFKTLTMIDSMPKLLQMLSSRVRWRQ